MKKMSEACASCIIVRSCFISDFKRCPKIEVAAEGLGVPSKPEEVESYIKNVPFGVYMGLKHILKKKNEEAERYNKLRQGIYNIAWNEYGIPGMDTDGDNMVRVNNFINRLSRETTMSRVDCAHVVSNIMRLGNLNDAIRYYDKYGHEGLSNYMFAIQHPAMRKE